MVKNEGNVEVGGFPPYPISFRSIVPKREECTNLTVPVCMSASHIAYGSIRMEPVFMVLAQTSAIAASMAIDQKIPVQMVSVPEIQKVLKVNPILDKSSAEILVDDGLNSQMIDYKGKWSIGEGKISKYGSSIMTAENIKGNSVRFNCKVEKAGNYAVYYYYPKFQDPQNIDSVNFTVFSGKKEISVKRATHDPGFISNDSKGTWINLGKYPFKTNQSTWVQLSQKGPEGKQLLAADAVIWAPEK